MTVRDVGAKAVIRKHRLLTTEHLLTGVSLARIAYGLFLLFYLISHYAERHLLWGPDGLLPHDAFLEASEARGILTLFHLSGSPGFFELVYHAGFVIAFLYLIGYRTRLVGVLTFILFWSFYFRNPHLTNGGDNILRLQLFYLMFAHAGAHFSVDALRRKRLLPEERASQERCRRSSTTPPSWQRSFSSPSCISPRACIK